MLKKFLFVGLSLFALNIPANGNIIEHNFKQICQFIQSHHLRQQGALGESYSLQFYDKVVTKLQSEAIDKTFVNLDFHLLNFKKMHALKITEYIKRGEFFKLKNIFIQLDQALDKKLLSKNQNNDYFLATFINIYLSFLGPHSHFYGLKELQDNIALNFSKHVKENKNLEFSKISLNESNKAWNFKIIAINKFYQSRKEMKQYYKDIHHLDLNTVKKRTMEDFSHMGERSKNISYVELSQKYSSLVLSVKAELEKIYQSKTPIDGIIIDLRGNSGGSLAEAINLADLFLSNEIIVTEQTRWQAQTHIYRSSSSHIVYSGPLMILVDKHTASSAEIFAAAMQDYKRAIVIGTDTWGKGTGQLTKMFANGLLVYTSSQLFRPNGKSTQVKGVRPDIVLRSKFFQGGQFASEEKSLPQHFPFRELTVEKKDDLYKYLYTGDILSMLSSRATQRFSKIIYPENFANSDYFFDQIARVLLDAINFEYSNMHIEAKNKLFPKIQQGNVY